MYPGNPQFGQGQPYGGHPIHYPPQPVFDFRKPRPRGRVIGLVVGSVVTVFALVVGAAVWLAWPEPAGSSAPFYQALSSLSSKPALRYRTTVPSSAHTWDVTVTATGDTTGTVSVDGQSSEIVRAGGQLYLGPASGTRDDLGRAPVSAANRDKWQTAPEPIETEAAVFSSPALLASWLAAQLDRADLRGRVQVGDEPALRAETEEGTLDISVSEPYRVLRWAPADDTDAAELVLTEVADSLDQVRAALQNAIGRLAGAVNSDFTFRPGQGALTCSTAGCSVRQPFTGRITRSDRARVTGTATVTLTATISVEGRHGGRCSASGSFPLETNGFNGELTCTAPEAGAVFAAVSAEKQAAAERQAQAERRTVNYETRFAADTEVVAEAVGQAQVQGLLDAIEEGLREPDCDAANSFVAGTPVLLADGTVRAIQQITVGTPVAVAAPSAGLRSTSSVRSVVHGIGGRSRELVTLTITDGDRTAIISATTNHPFWVPALSRWVDAGDLKPGTLLAGRADERPRVVEARREVSHAPVYNLEVDGPHTYYVVAGNTSVLVHNCPAPKGGPPSARKEIRNAVELLRAGQLPQRLNPDGTPDIFEGRPGTPAAVARKWADSSIYEVPGLGNQFRLLRNAYGDVGWTDNHYGRIIVYAD
ncbi:Hint domain-containing protein [Nocardia sp. NPDC023988]|uniref:Hint domain-containing protein n=1 Tax=unclassified Nocardia TaxID=2637762 RepID=UPI0033F3F032